jgi:hypothetical protein
LEKKINENKKIKREVGKKKRKSAKKREKKKERNGLWITIVIHSAFGCRETVISPHPLVLC